MERWLYRLGLLWVFAVLNAGAASVTENFSSSPSSSGWRVFGDASLFTWNSNAQHLEVTWDSSRGNSYFFHPLGTILGKDDEFSLSFDVRLTDISSGIAPDKPYTFQLALGFLHLATAANSNFVRGSGTQSPNLVEWNYFPAFLAFEPTIAQAIVSTNGQWLYDHENLLPMTTGDLFHVEMQFRNRTLTSTITRNGATYGSPQTIRLRVDDPDFRVDTVAVSSYSDGGQDPPYAGSILAHGIVDNIAWNVPDPPVTQITGRFDEDNWRVEFSARTNWIYVLERTREFQNWRPVVTNAPLTDGPMSLTDSESAGETLRLYRVRAERP